MPPIRNKRVKFTVTQKLEIVKDHLRHGTSVYALAKRHGVQGNQVLRWVQSHEKPKAAVRRSPRAAAINPGRPVAKLAVEESLLEYFNYLRDSDVAISTKMLGQKMTGELTEIKNDFLAAVCDRLIPVGAMEVVHWDHVVNMDETPVYFEPKINTTIARKRSKTVSARVCSSHNPRITVALTVTVTGKQLPRFVVFKGVPGARIKSGLGVILPDGVFATCQASAWMDERTTKLWADKVWNGFEQPLASSSLLLDDYKCHKQSSFCNKLADVDTDLEIIPGTYYYIYYVVIDLLLYYCMYVLLRSGFSCVLQPLDVGINKPFNDNVRHQYMMWASKNMPGNLVVPTPSRRFTAMDFTVHETIEDL
ncbi:hypothetical protein AaE_014059 [Aphanomyces astaci]|uniref:DDE-1 domain-containing protein n=1 Tax=Aphanomyces astaci TaxID=112090 RepID=A0A6A4Z562_APHAT|nr:hypothetical protein AaE_014059 [Aphanomyces astaci]